MDLNLILASIHSNTILGCGQPGQDAVVVLKKPEGVCLPGTFNSNANDRNECLNCFCFGITDECTSTELFLNKVGKKMILLYLILTD